MFPDFIIPQNGLIESVKITHPFIEYHDFDSKDCIKQFFD